MTIGRLIPVPGAEVVLKKGVERLPEMCISSRHEKIALGRNGITKIDDPHMNRREGTLTVLENGKMAVTDAKRILINGTALTAGSTTTLRDGDKISIMDDRYSFLVRYKSERKAADVPQANISPRRRSRQQATDVTEEEPAALAAPASEAFPASFSLPKALVEELYCPLCLELQVEPVAIDPCGHSFCKVCSTKVTQCPNCRVDIKGRYPNVSFANIISCLATTTSLLPGDDVVSYDERTPAQKRVKRKCGRSQDDAILID